MKIPSGRLVSSRVEICQNIEFDYAKRNVKQRKVLDNNDVRENGERRKFQIKVHLWEV